MPRKDEVRLAHILDAIAEVEQIVKGLTQSDLAEDRIKQLAITKLIEIIGEAASNLTPATREAIPGINWSAVIAMRNRLIHAYFDVDYEIVWATIQQDLPELKQHIFKHLHG